MIVTLTNITNCARAMTARLQVYDEDTQMVWLLFYSARTKSQWLNSSWANASALSSQLHKQICGTRDERQNTVQWHTHPCQYVRATHDHYNLSCTAQLRWTRKGRYRQHHESQCDCSSRVPLPLATVGRSRGSSLTSWTFSRAVLNALNWSRFAPSWWCSLLWSSCCKRENPSSSVTFTSLTSMNFSGDRAFISTVKHWECCMQKWELFTKEKVKKNNNKKTQIKSNTVVVSLAPVGVLLLSLSPCVKCCFFLLPSLCWCSSPSSSSSSFWIGWWSFFPPSFFDVAQCSLLRSCHRVEIKHLINLIKLLSKMENTTTKRRKGVSSTSQKKKDEGKGTTTRNEEAENSRKKGKIAWCSPLPLTSKKTNVLKLLK